MTLERPGAGLHVLADDDPRWRNDPVRQARAACEGGASVVQLRCKHLGDRDTLALARELRAITRDHRVTFVVNDRFDLALASDADGVHLGQGDLPPDAIPEAARERLAIGLSTHDPEQASAAIRVLRAGDYLAFGPLFRTASKETGYDARGCDPLSEIVGMAGRLPVIAIGGIDAKGARQARAAGADGVAVVSAVANARDPVAATRRLVAALAVSP